VTEIVKITSNQDGLLFASRPEAPVSTSRKFWGVREKSFRVSNPDNIFLINGSFAEVELNTGLSLLSSFLLFIVPLLVFPLVYSILTALYLAEFISVILAMGGVVGTVSLNRFFLKGEKHFPVVKKKVEGNIKKSGGCDSCGACR